MGVLSAHSGICLELSRGCRCGLGSLLQSVGRENGCQASGHPSKQVVNDGEIVLSARILCVLQACLLLVPKLVPCGVVAHILSDSVK